MPIIFSRVNVAWQRLFILLFIIEGAFKKSDLAPDRSFWKWNMLFLEFLMKNDFLCACWFDWSGWIAFINSEILITTGMDWPVSSDKWKAHWAKLMRVLGVLINGSYNLTDSPPKVLNQRLIATNIGRVTSSFFISNMLSKKSLHVRQFKTSLDSGFHKQKFPFFQNLDSLTL